MALTPADPGYQIQRMVDEIAELRKQVGTLMRAPQASGRRARVSALAAGSMVKVEWLIGTTPTGTFDVVPYLLGYAPAVGHGGHVVDLGSGRMFIPVSAF